MRIHTDYSGRANVRCYLSTTEKLDFGERLANTSKRIEDLKSSQKSAAASYASQIKEQEAIRERLVDAISSGFEMRDVACTWRMNQPHTGMKTLYRNDTYEAVDTKVMSDAEKQGVLDLEEAREAEDAESQARVEEAHNARADAQVETPGDGAEPQTEEPLTMEGLAAAAGVVPVGDIEPTESAPVTNDEAAIDAPAEEPIQIGENEFVAVHGMDAPAADTTQADDTADDAGVKTRGGKRYVSPETRKRIAAALEARQAEARAAHAKGEPLTPEEVNADFDADETAAG